MNTITDNHSTTRINQDGSTTITDTNGNTTTFGPDDTNTIGNRLGTVETGLDYLENEIDGTDTVVNDLNRTVETSSQNINRIALV